MTDHEESVLIHDKLHGVGWMGSSDIIKEGEWKWVTGPEGCPPYAAGATGATRSACDFGYPILEEKEACQMMHW